MTGPLVTALLLDGTAILLLVHRLRHQIWRHVGALFVIMAVLYHGVGEVVNRVGAPGLERIGLSTAQLDRWQLFVGPAILLFTFAYLAVLGRSGILPAREGDGKQTAAFYSWKLLAIITAPMYLYVLSGHGGAVSGAAQTGTSHTETGLASQFLLLAMVVTAYSFVVEKGQRRLLPTLVLQSGLLLLLGERLRVGAGAVMLLFALSLSGYKFSRRHVWAMAAVVVIAGVALSASRVTVGRQAYGASSGTSARVTAALSGFVHPSRVFTNLGQQYFNRLDGNDFAAFTLAGISRGIPPMGARTFYNDIALAVPSALNPQKLNTSVLTRSEEAAFESQYGMGTMNRLPTTLGTLAGYDGPYVFELLALVLGVSFAVVDRWLRRITPVRLVAGVGLVGCVVHYERDLSQYTTTLRGVVLLLVVVKLVQFAKHTVVKSMFGSMSRQSNLMTDPTPARPESSGSRG